MTFIADTHVHLYPFYDVGAAFVQLGSSLRDLGKGLVRVACLAERSDCRGFAELREQAGGAPLGRCRVSAAGEAGALEIVDGDGVPFYLVAGRQIVTAERVEILALAVEDVGDVERRPAEQVVEAVLSAGGIPVVGWAPGKWLFARRRVVAGLFQTFQPGQLLAGDTTLRPTGWGEPRLMREAARRGFGVVAGSDPLPFPGEERMLGAYASVIDGEWRPEQPVTSLRAALRSVKGPGVRSGRRCGPLTTMRRLLRNAVSRS